MEPIKETSPLFVSELTSQEKPARPVEEQLPELEWQPLSVEPPPVPPFKTSDSLVRAVDAERLLVRHIGNLEGSREQAQRDSRGLHAWLQPEAGTHVLEIQSGLGHHAVALANLGVHVVATERSSALLAHARLWGEESHTDKVTWVQQEPCRLAFPEVFPAAYCLMAEWSGFTPEHAKEWLQSLYRVLLPGGTCVLGFWNRDYMVSELPVRHMWHGETFLVEEEAAFDYQTEQLVLGKQIHFRDGRIWQHTLASRLYTYRELSMWFEQAGFEWLEARGEIALPVPWMGADSRRLWCLLRKPAEETMEYTE